MPGPLFLPIFSLWIHLFPRRSLAGGTSCFRSLPSLLETYWSIVVQSNKCTIWIWKISPVPPPLHTHSQLEINLRPILDCCTKTCLISLTSFSAYKFIPLKCTAAAFALERVFANSSLAKKTLHFLELPISSHRSLPCLICLVSGQ